MHKLLLDTQGKPAISGRHPFLGEVLSVPAIAVPVALVAPVDALVSQHKGVYGVAMLNDGCRCPCLRIEDCVAHLFMAAEHLAVFLQNLHPHLPKRAGMSSQWRVINSGCYMRQVAA